MNGKKGPWIVEADMNQSQIRSLQSTCHEPLILVMTWAGVTALICQPLSEPGTSEGVSMMAYTFYLCM